MILLSGLHVASEGDRAPGIIDTCIPRAASEPRTTAELWFRVEVELECDNPRP